MTLIVCPLKAELQILVRCLKSDGYAIEEHRKGPLSMYVCQELGWIIAPGGHGKTQFAIQTQFLVQNVPYVKNVICAGACGSLSPAVKTGDVVVATSTVEHDYKDGFSKQSLPQFQGCSVTEEKIRAASVPVHFGIIASGDEDIIDHDRSRRLADETGAIAVAWEGAGGARACRFLSVPFTEIRGVTDFADSAAMQDFKTHLDNAMTSVYGVLKSSFGK